MVQANLVCNNAVIMFINYYNVADYISVLIVQMAKYPRTWLIIAIVIQVIHEPRNLWKEKPSVVDFIS